MKFNKNTAVQILISSSVLIFSLLIALILGSIILLTAGVNPISAYSAMIIEPVSSFFGISEAFVRAVPLMLVGTGISIAFRSQMINIGAEGQIQLGAVAGGAAAIFFSGMPKEAHKAEASSLSKSMNSLLISL